MIMKYYVNKQPQVNRDYVVHQEDCADLPTEEKRSYLGEFSSCFGAVFVARQIYLTANGCNVCSGLCFTG